MMLPFNFSFYFLVFSLGKVLPEFLDLTRCASIREEPATSSWYQASSLAACDAALCWVRAVSVQAGIHSCSS